MEAAKGAARVFETDNQHTIKKPTLLPQLRAQCFEKSNQQQRVAGTMVGSRLTHRIRTEESHARSISDAKVFKLQREKNINS
ncbi:hypothetical protein DMENIID0001_092360 [Sergentomyia squamirostris]